MLKKITYFFFIFLLPSCITPVDYDDIQEVDPSLVVSSYITPDSLMEFFVGKTTDMFSDDASVSDGSVQIWNNGTLLESVLPNDTGHFVSSIYPTIGEEYRIIANGSGLRAEASTRIPASAGTIDTVSSVWPGGHDDNRNETYKSYSITIDDPIAENYYELVVFGLDSIHTLRVSESGELIFVFERVSYRYTDIISDDPVIKNEDRLYRTDRLLFTDKLFNGQKYILSAKVFSLMGMRYSCEIVTLRTVSRDYYLYRKSLHEHWFNQGRIESPSIEELAKMQLFGSPVDVYTNIENGYGVFAGYTSFSYQLESIK